MAKAEYIISLIRSHYNNEPERFTTLAGLSHAEISLACSDAIKYTILNEKTAMSNDLILKAIKI